jgi:hypothetical protein
MSNSNTPDAQDLVLGGTVTPPVTGAVLGGILGLNQRFENADLVQKLAALVEASQHGEAGIELLNRGLQDQDLRVRMEAYLQLKASAPDTPELDRGIPLKVGDRIYAVYESDVSYGDDFYYVHASLYDEGDEEDEQWYYEENPFYHSTTDSNGHSFDYVSDMTEDHDSSPWDEKPKLIAYYTDASTAGAKVQVVYQEKFGKLGCEIYEIAEAYEPEGRSTPAFNLRAWVVENQVVVDSPVPFGWTDSDEIEEIYSTKVLISLLNQKQFGLLREIWQQLGYRPLGFVHERVIDRPCYLRLAALL